MSKQLNAKGHLAKILDRWFACKLRRGWNGAELEDLMSAADECLVEKYGLSRSVSRFVQLEQLGLAYQDEPQSEDGGGGADLQFQLTDAGRELLQTGK